MQTADYLESLQNDLSRINTALELSEGTNFTDIAEMAEDGDITAGGSIDEYFYNENRAGASRYDYEPALWTYYVKKLPSNISLQSGTTSLHYAFKYFYTLDDLDLSNFDTRNVTDFYAMFYRAYFKSLIVGSNFTIESATDLSYMFQNSYCTTLDLSFLGETPCSNFSNMFNACSLLTTLNIQNLKSTSNSAPNLMGMFTGSPNLTFIDVRSFTFSTTTTAPSQIFGNTSSFGPKDNCLIIVKDDTEKTFITSNLPRLTNVQTAAEYEANASI